MKINKHYRNKPKRFLKEDMRGGERVRGRA